MSHPSTELMSKFFYLCANDIPTNYALVDLRTDELSLTSNVTVADALDHAINKADTLTKKLNEELDYSMEQIDHVEETNRIIILLKQEAQKNQETIREITRERDAYFNGLSLIKKNIKNKKRL